MQWISNAREMRELDRSAIGERGIPSTRLMEAAARAVADYLALELTRMFLFLVSFALVLLLWLLLSRVLDLACGTGTMSFLLAERGYEVIGVDFSPEMLAVAAEKSLEGEGEAPIFLCQSMEELDLYGTIRGAVSTFDTFNHIPDLDTAIANAGFFMEKGGVFLFDMNTPYKHQNVLGDNEFTFEEEDAACVWRNHYDAANRRVEITVDIDYHETGEHFHEQFCEYTYDLDTIRTALEKHGFALESVCDGETFGPLTEDSQRYFFCAVKQYTQLEG